MQNPSKNKLQLFSFIGVLIFTAIAGGIYYFSQAQDVPPSLALKRSTFQGFSKDVEFGSVKWEKSDLKTYDDKVAELKKSGIDTGIAAKADANRTNILFAIKDTTLKEIVDSTSREESKRVIWAVYQGGSFIMTQNDYFNTVDSKGNVVAKIVDTSNTKELEKIKIKENESVFLMSDYKASNPLLRSELDIPKNETTLDSLTKGWHVLAMKDAATLLKDVDPNSYSLWGTKNNKDFAKLKTPSEKENYNNIVWINVKVDKLTKQVVLTTIDATNTDVTLSKDPAVSQSIKQGTKNVSLAKFDVTSTQNFSINKVTLDYTGVSGALGANDIATLYVSVTSKGITASSTQAKPKFPLSIIMDYKLEAQDKSAVIEVKADMTVNAYTNPNNNKHTIKLTEIGFGGNSTLTKSVEGNTMTIIQSDPLTAEELAEAKAEQEAKDKAAADAKAAADKAAADAKASAQNTKLEVKNVKVLFDGKDLGTGTVTIDDKGMPTKELKFLWNSTYNAATIAQYSDTAKTKPALSYTWSITDSTGKTTIWALSKEWGNNSGEGVTKGDADCFKPLYGAGAVGLDWICNYTSLPGGIVFTSDTSYTVTIKAFDGVTDSAAATATFKTAKQAKIEAIIDPTKVQGEIIKDETGIIYNLNQNYTQTITGLNILNNLQLAPTKLSAPDLSSGVTCKGDVCSLGINTHFEDYVYFSISQFKIKIDNGESKTIDANSISSEEVDTYYHKLDSSVDMTKSHTFEVQILSDKEYGQQGGEDISKNQESEWGKYTYAPSINSFDVQAAQGSEDVAKLDLSWVDSSYNKDTDQYKISKEIIVNESWTKCLLENIKDPNAHIICNNKVLFNSLEQFNAQQPSDITVYGDTILYTTFSANKYNEVKIRIQRCLKNSNTCYPKSEEVYYHPAPIISVTAGNLGIDPIDKDPSKIKSYTVSYKLMGTKDGAITSGGWGVPNTFDTSTKDNPTLKSWNITDIVGNTDSSTRTYEITVHKNYLDGTLNLESNKVTVVVTGSSVTLASANPSYGFASVFDETLDSLFNIFK